MRLVLAVLQDADIEPLLAEFAALGIAATQIHGDAAVGRNGLAAVIVGVDDDRVEDVVGVIHAKARRRVRRGDPLRPIGERAASWVPVPVEQSAGGASVFVLPVRRFERIGYA
jgi:uncharacterized protein YaaQ